MCCTCSVEISNSLYSLSASYRLALPSLVPTAMMLRSDSQVRQVMSCSVVHIMDTCITPGSM